MLNTNVGTLTFHDLKSITEIERKAKLPVNEGKVEPTESLLNSIVSYFKSEKTQTITLTQAYYALLALYWQKESEGERKILKSAVSFWFHFDTSNHSDKELLGYYANIPRVRAQKQIAEHKYDATDFESVYNLFILAFDDEELAVEARNQSIKSRMKQQGSTNV